MGGLRIFLSAAGKLFGEFEVLVRVLFVPALLSWITGIYVWTKTVGFLKGFGTLSGLEALVPMLGASALALLPLAWGLVAWMRFVLIDESPRGFLPKVQIALILSLYWRLVFMASVFVVFLVVIFGSLIIVLELVENGAVLSVVAFGLAWVVFFLLLSRFSLALPASAIGQNVSFLDSWRQTRLFSREIVEFSLWLLALRFVGEMSSPVLGSVRPIAVAIDFFAYPFVFLCVLTASSSLFLADLASNDDS